MLHLRDVREQASWKCVHQDQIKGKDGLKVKFKAFRDIKIWYITVRQPSSFDAQIQIASQPHSILIIIFI